MNSRLTIQDLAALLAERTGKDRNSAEQFLREFIAIVSQGVFTDKIAKVKGLGTFKVILVEKRESIHVNTGERFLIPAHYKFSFLPDKELRELVNKPFSFFETTELNENVDFTDLDVSADVEEKETEDESVEEVIPENEEEQVVESLQSTEEVPEDTEKEELPEDAIQRRIRNQYFSTYRNVIRVFYRSFIIVIEINPEYLTAIIFQRDQGQTATRFYFHLGQHFRCFGRNFRSRYRWFSYNSVFYFFNFNIGFSFYFMKRIDSSCRLIG